MHEDRWVGEKSLSTLAMVEERAIISPTTRPLSLSLQLILCSFLVLWESLQIRLVTTLGWLTISIARSMTS